jgi:uncharacterized paraquat-inducible protein A
MRDPAVTCQDCRFVWYSPAMAHGLRALGSCPRCGGVLHFHGDAAPIEPATIVAEPQHVLGIPLRR